ncbi:hypothetical protein [Halomonas denitrificans]|uniref:COG4648 family protein n=1 Tax=Halomonas denitrificans TaxID=370769 RepID=UPI0021BDD9D1|nr:hypothetical protein [Halomonas denitrificans]
MRTRTVSAKAVTIGLSLAWPFAVWGLSGILGPWPLLLTGCALVAWRLPQARGLAAIAALTLLALGLTVDAELGVRGYPVAVNTVLLATFALSLWRGMPVVERLARLQEPNLPPAGVRYTRVVTQVWCLFFVVNGTIAAWTAAYADLDVWTLYNGVISYVLIALMFAGEWLCRRRLRSPPP